MQGRILQNLLHSHEHRAKNHNHTFQTKQRKRNTKHNDFIAKHSLTPPYTNSLKKYTTTIQHIQESLENITQIVFAPLSPTQIRHIRNLLNVFSQSIDPNKENLIQKSNAPANIKLQLQRYRLDIHFRIQLIKNIITSYLSLTIQSRPNARHMRQIHLINSNNSKNSLGA